MDDSLAVVLPYYNEVGFLRPTIASLLDQTQPIDQLILVNNGSTDGSENLCRELLAGCSIPDVVYLDEPRPGKTYALERATGSIRTALVAFVDADTYYPVEYFELCRRLLRQGGPQRCAVLAKDLYGPADCWSGVWNRWFFALLSRILYWQAFSGGCGQVFRTAAYRAAGGYSVGLWTYTIEDHEIINRLRKVGRVHYDPKFWCMPSPRRCDRSRVGWSRLEQFVYHVIPPGWGDWFFGSFLAGRFERRRIYQANLRQHDWEADPRRQPAPVHAAAERPTRGALVSAA